MKKTGVAQGLKSLADKIHPNGNAPLTAGESKRLLTALTSSFRRHLEAAHPTTVTDDRKVRAEGQGQRVPQVTASGIHSSAAFAQRHMASVLTNPLLLKGGKDYASAKLALAAHKDPMELLEEYDREGVATVRIAELCLHEARKDCDSASTERKLKLLEELRPGIRVFRWLLQTGMHTSATFADNVRFIDQLVFFLVREGQQDKIWHWLKMDLKAPAGPEGAPVNTTRSVKKLMLYHYRWRGRVLAALIEQTVGVTRNAIPEKTQSLRASNLHRGIDFLFDAEKLRQIAPADIPPEDWHHLVYIPLGHTVSFLVKLLTRRITPINKFGDVKLVDGDHIDPVRFDRLIECVRYSNHLGPRSTMSRKEGSETDSAMLHMVHPSTPSAEYMLEELRMLMPDDRAKTKRRFLAMLAEDHAVRQAWGYTLAQCASLLAEDGKHDDAAWVRSRVPIYVPDLGPQFDQEERGSTFVRTRSSAGTDSGPAAAPARLPFPTVA